MMNFIDGMLTPTQTAAALGVSAGTLNAWVLRHGFPAPSYFGKRKYFPAAAVAAWVSHSDRLVSTETWHLTGEGHPNCTHPKEIVAQAVKMHMEGKGLGSIGKILGVPKATVQKWVDGTRRALNPEDVAAREQLINSK